MQAAKLQTNHLTAPIGMGTGPLFLSWQCTDGMRQTERRMFRMAFLLMARISVRSAMRASIPLFYEQSPFCSSFSLEFAFNNAHFDDSCNLHLILDNQAWVLRLEEYGNNIKILKLQKV